MLDSFGGRRAILSASRFGRRFWCAALLAGAVILTSCGGSGGQGAGNSTPPAGASGSDWYVSPTGQSANTGARLSPWDLATALSQPVQVKPGDRIWMLAGDYVGHFTSSLSGTASAPITVQAEDGARATIADNRRVADGATLQIDGGWTIYTGFEITNTEPDRSNPAASASEVAFRPMGLQIQAPHTQIRHLVVHDVGIGCGFWEEAVDSEIYGCLIYNCGTQNTASDKRHGHAIYCNNSLGTKRIRSNIISNQFGLGIQGWPGDNGHVVGISIEDNIILNSGVLTGATNRFGNIFFGAASYAPNPLGGITIARNILADSLDAVPGAGELNVNLLLGSAPAGVVHRDVAITDNSVIGGPLAFGLESWTDATVTGNTFAGSLGLVSAIAPAGHAPYAWNSNRYLGAGSGSAVFGWQNTALTFSAWQSATGFDASGTSSPVFPAAPEVRIIPSAYDDRRENAYVINWPLAASIAVDPSAVLQPGDDFVVRNGQDFFGPPVLSGRYAGGPLMLPMSGLSAAVPIGSGYNGTAPPFGPLVGAFVIVRAARPPSAHG